MSFNIIWHGRHELNNLQQLNSISLIYLEGMENNYHATSKVFLILINYSMLNVVLLIVIKCYRNIITYNNILNFELITFFFVAVNYFSD